MTTVRKHLYTFPNSSSNMRNFPNAGLTGQVRTYELVQRRYYWPYMCKDIDRYVGNCHVSQRSKVSRQSSYCNSTTGMAENKHWSCWTTTIQRIWRYMGCGGPTSLPKTPTGPKAPPTSPLPTTNPKLSHTPSLLLGAPSPYPPPSSLLSSPNPSPPPKPYSPAVSPFYSRTGHVTNIPAHTSLVNFLLHARGEQLDCCHPYNDNTEAFVVLSFTGNAAAYRNILSTLPDGFINGQKLTFDFGFSYPPEGIRVLDPEKVERKELTECVVIEGLRVGKTDEWIMRWWEGGGWGDCEEAMIERFEIKGVTVKVLFGSCADTG